jgi:radial spoke head protein 1
MKWKDGSKYIGEYFKGQKDGLGTFKYNSGNFFRGFWIKGKRDGVGVFYNGDGI